MASLSVWLLVALVVAGVPSNEAGSGKALNADRRGDDNPKTALCPNGQTFLDQCNWARCDETGQVSSTFMLCLDWTCALAMASVSDEACYGLCTCNPTTLITSCERKGC